MASDLQQYNEIVKLLKGIKDEASAAAALPKLKELTAKRLQIEELGPPPAEIEREVQTLAVKMGAISAFNSFFEEAFRIEKEDKYPEIAAALDAMIERRRVKPAPMPGDNSKPLLQCAGLTQGIYDVDYSPDGKWIAAVAWNKELKIWDAENGREKLSVPLDAKSVHFLSDSNTVAVNATPPREFPGLYLFNLTTGKPAGSITVKGEGDSVANFFHIDSNATGFACLGNNRLGMWKMPRAQLVGNWPSETNGHCLALSADGKRIATSDGILFDTKTGNAVTKIRTTSAIGDLTHSVSFSADSKVVGFMDMNGVRFLDASTGRELRTFGGDQQQVFQFSPSGKVFVLCGSRVTLFDMETLKPVHNIPVSQDQSAIACTFSPDGKRLVTGYNDGGIDVWDISKFAFATAPAAPASEEPASELPEENPAPATKTPAPTQPSVTTKPGKAAPALRTWSSADGQFEVDATYIAHDATYVEIKKKDGKVIKVPLDKLSDGDRNYLRTRN